MRSLHPHFQLRIPADFFAAMIAHAQHELPNECVGMLAGKPDGLVQVRYPLVNALADPRRFESEPRSMFLAEKARRAAGLEFLAVYHSHPTSAPVPSRHDLAWHYSAEVQCVIISLVGEVPEVQAYWLSLDGYAAAPWQVLPTTHRPGA